MGDPAELAWELEFPAVTVEMLDEADAVERRWGADPRFRAITIPADRSELVVWWQAGSNVPQALLDAKPRLRVEFATDSMP